MARSTAELLEQLLRFLPPDYASAAPLLAGIAGPLARADVAIDELAEAAKFGGAEGAVLTLHAHGHGIRRAAGESDASLRQRLRNVEDQVTRPAIQAAVDAIIAPDTCTIVEWWEEPYLDVEDATGAWLDNAECLLSGGPNSFLVVIPDRGMTFEFGAHLDSDFWLDIEFLGDAVEDPVYAAVINEVNRLRAAGTFWRLVLEL